MSDKADRRGWLNLLYSFSRALSQLNYKLVSLPSHLGNWADKATKLLPLTMLAQVSVLVKRPKKQKQVFITMGYKYRLLTKENCV